MTVPSQADIKKREDKLKEFMKRLNEDGSPQEKHVVAVVRSAIRQAWMKSDVKLAYLYSKTIPDLDDSTRTKWLVRCEICEGLFKLSDVEIDHKEGNHSFVKVEDFKNYFDNILMVNFDGLQVLCKEGCHATKSYMEKYGCTWDEAVVQKEAISIIKSKKELSWLKEHGIVPASNAEKRRNQIIEELSK
jgi:hypothetical protein